MEHELLSTYLWVIGQKRSREPHSALDPENKSLLKWFKYQISKGFQGFYIMLIEKGSNQSLKATPGEKNMPLWQVFVNFLTTLAFFCL